MADTTTATIATEADKFEYDETFTETDNGPESESVGLLYDPEFLAQNHHGVNDSDNDEEEDDLSQYVKGDGDYYDDEYYEEDESAFVGVDIDPASVSKGAQLTSSNLKKQMTGSHTNQNTNGNRSRAVQGSRSKTEKLASLNKKVYLGKFKVASNVSKQMEHNHDRMDKNNIRKKEKADRATVEQVLDPRTRMILFKIINQGIINEVNGCVSTGKEANVYHCSSKTGDLAVKIYKTSILVFKDRDRYVSGEHRFRKGYCKSNPRKMVRVWAEKEMRNLKRMESAGIPCPKVRLLRQHVLLMDFIGQDGWPAPRLKDAKLSTSRMRECYMQCIKLMRVMYQVCHLVHADLSEYNILYYQKSLFFIDVSQSVEHEHPRALDFLRKDIVNVNKFFKQGGVATMNLRELYDFVTDESIKKEEEEEYLLKAQEKIALRVKEGISVNDEIDEQVFLQSYIPRTLAELEIDVDKQMDGEAQFTGLIADAVSKMANDGNLVMKREKDEKEREREEEEEEYEEEYDEEEGEEYEEGDEEGEEEEEKVKVHKRDMPKLTKEEVREQRKKEKKAAKEETRAKRQEKMKKKDKKRKIKATTHKKK